MNSGMHWCGRWLLQVIECVSSAGDEFCVVQECVISAVKMLKE
jgi:hypothetical protein